MLIPSTEQINVSNYANSRFMHDLNVTEIKFLNYCNNVLVKIFYRFLNTFTKTKCGLYLRRVHAIELYMCGM